MVSGGMITTEAGFLPAIQAAHRTFYPAYRPILMVLNATLPDERDAMEKRMAQYFASNGFTAESLHHHSGGAARRKLNEAAAVFVGGGETFLLLRNLQDTGLLGLLRERVLDGLPYHGTSAGANLAGPLIGCTNDFPVVDLASRAALGVFPAVMNPHHPSVHEAEYAARAGKIQRYRRINPADTVLGLTNASVAVLQQRKVSLTSGAGFLYGATNRPLSLGPIAELS
jgi:dipeptidase E